MYVCVCKAVTDHHIRDAVIERGITSLAHLARDLGACKQCGKCAHATREVMENCLQEQAVDRTVLTNTRSDKAIAA